jgi:hypothetical protein
MIPRGFRQIAIFLADYPRAEYTELALKAKGFFFQSTPELGIRTVAEVSFLPAMQKFEAAHDHKCSISASGRGSEH